MSTNNLYKQYKETEINTANQGKLIIMLYEGAIKFINKALESIPKKEIEDAHNNIIKTKDIITELTTSLDMEAGEISQRLFSIYMYINRRLSAANLKKDIEPLMEVKQYLVEMKNAWEEANKKVQLDNLNHVEKGGINIAT